ncbi:MAG: hypothetical protein LBI45_04340, partial [Bacteroidales bacterium]|nr:hypothetical protein [Bacteroidales bacterium]
MKKFLLIIAAILLVLGTVSAQQTKSIYPEGSLHIMQTTQLEDYGTRAPGDVVYTEGFETTTGTALPAGWTVSHTGTADSWISLGLNLIYGTPPDIGNIPGVIGLVPTHSGNRMLGLSWQQTGRNAWAISSGIALTAGKWYSVSFWLMMPGYGAEISGLECRIGQSNTAAGLSTASLIYKNTTQTVVGWTKVSGVFQATTTGNYYLGFHDLTAAQEGIYTTIDDIEIVEADPASIIMNDLSISGANPLTPFTKVPASQVAGLLVAGNMPFPNKFVAQVSNVGAATQTNVSFSANLDGTNLGAPATIASIAPNVTETMTLYSQGMYYPYAAGNHNIEYKVTQTQTDENPANNTATFTLEIGNKYQMDAITDYTLTGVGSNTATLTLGNIFTITNNTTLTDVEVGFLNNPAIVGINYTVSLYRMSNATTTLAHTFTTANQPRPASGTVTVTVPPTALTPGQYYVAINQLTASNIGVSYDTRPESNRCYTKTYSATGAAGAVTMQSGFGALAIRMITSGGTTPSCFVITASPNNPDYGSVTGGGVYFGGTPVTLLAKPKFGYEFVRWSDNTTANPYPTFNVSADFSITAIFQEKNLCEDKIVGTGTTTVNYSPINTFWGHTYSQQIYTAADIGKTGEIKSIAFEYINAIPYNANNVTIYMGVTNKSSFTNAQDLVPVSELQQVFSGSVPFSNVNKWSTINLNIPFPYTCGNLVVAVVNNQGNDMGSSATFRVSTPTPAGNYAISYYQDSGPINPSAPTASSMNAYSIRPNAKFEVCDVINCSTEKQIGTGTTPVRIYPFDYYYNNSYVQEIFTAADLGITAGAYISSLSFQHTFPANSRNVTVYIANTTKASFGGTTAAEWIPGAQLTKVYAGSLSMPTGWVTVPFDSPFEYTGENLVVVFLNQSAYIGASTDNRYLAHSTGTDNRVLYWFADAAFAGIKTPPTASGRATTRNNIIFNICQEAPPVDMTAASITGPVMIPALVQSTYAVTVKNFGGLVAKKFTVNVLNTANTVLGTATVTTPLASGASTVVDVTFAFPTTMVGNQNIKGQVIADCDANDGNNETPLFAVNVMSECAEIAGYVNIGTATTIGTTYNTIPFNFYYGNGVAQTIYLESELGFAPGTPIKKLTYKYNATIAVPEKPIKVYLTHTTLTNFGTGTATAANFIPTNTFTMVFDGQFSTAIGNNQELVINFDEPFIYQGG